MRLVKLMSWAGCLYLGAGLAMAQQPIAIGPDNTAGNGPWHGQILRLVHRHRYGWMCARRHGLLRRAHPARGHLLLECVDAECKRIAGDQRTADRRYD